VKVSFSKVKRNPRGAKIGQRAGGGGLLMLSDKEQTKLRRIKEKPHLRITKER